MEDAKIVPPSSSPVDARTTAPGLSSGRPRETPDGSSPSSTDAPREPAAAPTRLFSDVPPPTGTDEGPKELAQPTAPTGATSSSTPKEAEVPTYSADAGEKREASETSSGDGRRRPEAIDIPAFEVRRLDADERALERAGNTRPIDAHPVSGIWQQLGGPSTSDFGPGGYEHSVLMLNPDTKTAALYRCFRGRVTIVIGGELALDVPKSANGGNGGTLELSTSPSLPSRFATARIPLGGDPPAFAEPPAGTSPWRLTWKRDGPQLVLDGKRYVAVGVDVLESIRRGGNDASTDEERAERAPERAEKAGGARKPKEAAFFGVRGDGKRFAFIVDVSGSMQGPKLDRMKEELIKSIKGLDADAEFSVVFFSGSTRVIAQAWMSAGSDRARAIRLISEQGCEGGTDPSDAFTFAFGSLSPIPDCIFFMTDGLIPPTIPEQVRRLNAARIPTEIHSIVIGAPEDEPQMRPLMEQISSENRGTYTFVRE